MNFSVISLFPEYFDFLYQIGVTSRAFVSNSKLNQPIAKLEMINLRDFAENDYKSVDDSAYGGGGQVIRADVLAKALDQALENKPRNKTKVIHFAPNGKSLNQKKIKALAKIDNLVLVCSRYEGVDQRVINSRVDEVISIGDYVLTGGELAALVLIDSITRLLKGVINPESLKEESFDILSKENKLGLLEYPHYTKPAEFEGEKIPEVLLSGNHQKIKTYREKQALLTTWQYRPNLIKQYFDEADFKEHFQTPLDELLEKLLKKIKN